MISPYLPVITCQQHRFTACDNPTISTDDLCSRISPVVGCTVAKKRELVLDNTIYGDACWVLWELASVQPIPSHSKLLTEMAHL